MKKFRHKFRVDASVADVARFHSQSGSMGAITPPPVIAKIHRAPQTLTEGDEMEFTLWLAFLPIRWLARIENVSPAGFTDRQLRGPFKKWVHRHTFVAAGPAATEVVDEIECSLRPHILWGPVGLGMRLTLPLLFAYRSWKTRQLLTSTQLESQYVH